MSLKLELGKTYRDFLNQHWKIVRVECCTQKTGDHYEDEKFYLGENELLGNKTYAYFDKKGKAYFPDFCLVEEVHEITNSIPKRAVDPVVEQVCEELKKRSEKGIKKYGITLHDNKLSRKEWLQHAKEESLDLALYLQKLINIEDEETGPSDFNIEEHAKAISTARWDSLSTGTKEFFIEVAERSICHLRSKGVKI